MIFRQPSAHKTAKSKNQKSLQQVGELPKSNRDLSKDMNFQKQKQQNSDKMTES